MKRRARLDLLEAPVREGTVVVVADADLLDLADVLEVLRERESVRLRGI